jgi:transcriptional regulator with XRE-family HTH domain
MKTQPNRIKELRRALNLKQTEVAQRLGIDISNYSRLENGRTDIAYSRMVELGEIFGVPPEHIVAQAPSFRPIEVRGALQAGTWAESFEWHHDDCYQVAIPPDPRPGLYGGEIRGVSMDKVYPEGTVVVLLPFIESGESLMPGKRYHVERQSSDGLIEATIKKLWQDEAGTFWLLPESTDPRFSQPIALDGTEDQTIVIRGRVLFSVRRE